MKQIWNEKSTEKRRKISGIISLVFIILMFIVISTPYSYENFCHQQFKFNQSTNSYEMKQIFLSVLCPYPISKSNESISKNKNINESLKDFSFSPNEKDKGQIIIIDEIHIRKQMISFFLYYIKFNLILVLAFFSIYPWLDELKQKYKDYIKDIVLMSFVFWNLCIGVLTFLWFIMGWF